MMENIQELQNELFINSSERVTSQLEDGKPNTPRLSYLCN